MDWYDVKWFFRDVCDSVSNVAGNIYDVAADGVGAVTDFIEENPKTSIAIGTVVGIATAGVAAPAIAASIGATGVLGTTAGGTAISSLSGAALSSASLAALGGVQSQQEERVWLAEPVWLQQEEALQQGPLV